MGRIKDALSGKVAGFHDKFHPISVHTIDDFAGAARKAQAETVTLSVVRIKQEAQLVSVGPLDSGAIPGTSGMLIYGETRGAVIGKRTTLTMFEKNLDLSEQTYRERLQDMLPGVPVEFNEKQRAE